MRYSIVEKMDQNILFLKLLFMECSLCKIALIPSHNVSSCFTSGKRKCSKTYESNVLFYCSCCSEKHLLLCFSLKKRRIMGKKTSGRIKKLCCAPHKEAERLILSNDAKTGMTGAQQRPHSSRMDSVNRAGMSFTSSVCKVRKMCCVTEEGMYVCMTASRYLDCFTYYRGICRLSRFPQCLRELGVLIQRHRVEIEC